MNPTPLDSARQDHPATADPVALDKQARADTLARLTAAERLRQDPRVRLVVKAAETVEGSCRICQTLQASNNKAAQEAHAVNSAREAEQMARDLGGERKVVDEAARLAYRHHGGTVGWSTPADAKRAEKARKEANRWLAKQLRKRMGKPGHQLHRDWIAHRSAGGALSWDEFRHAHR